MIGGDIRSDCDAPLLPNLLPEASEDRGVKSAEWLNRSNPFAPADPERSLPSFAEGALVRPVLGLPNRLHPGAVEL
jgi:hypothetical protein